MQPPIGRCAALLGLLIAHSAYGETVHVVVRAEAIKAAPNARVEIGIEAISESKSSERVTARAAVGSGVTFELPPGKWIFAVTSDGYWGVAGQDVVDGQPSEVDLTVWPAATLATRVDFGREAVPAWIRVNFAPAPPPDRPSAPGPKGASNCTPKDGRALCKVPIGVLDLRLAAAGFVPHYRWAFSVTSAPATTTLGPIRFSRGGSVAGYVQTQEGRSVRGSRVRVTHLDGTHVLAPDANRPSRRPDETRYPFFAETNDRGFFQIGGLAAGDYRLFAEAPRGQAGTGVSINSDQETRLGAPLVLGPLATLALSIDPSRPPTGGAWTVRLLNISAQPALEEARVALVPDGTTRVERVSPGDYLLTVQDGEQRWFAETIRVEPESGPVHIDLDLVNVRGSVRLGSRSLPAKLAFGGFKGAQSIVLESDTNGEFRGVLPKRDRWRVDVRSDDPPVTRSLARVDIVYDSETEGRADIELADTVLRGRVVDSESDGVKGALVSLLPLGSRTDRPVQIRTDAGGLFELVGLPEGEVQLWASGLQARSPVATVRLSEAPVDVQLELQAIKAVNGRLISMPDGTPLGGGFVRAVPLEYPLLIVPTVRSDVQGQVRLSFPAGTREAAAIFGAPGRALGMMRCPVGAEGEVTFAVPQAAGTLTLEFDQPIHPRDRERLITVASRGVTASLPLVLSLAGIRLAEPSDRIALSPLQEADYGVCVAAAVGPAAGGLAQSTCTSGYLSAGGELVLQVKTR